jgi:L-lactate dehydrogenase complex protein LldE
MHGTETCCGFGGLFSVKFPDISNAMVAAKAANAAAVAPDLLLGGDLGCLMNVAGKLTREGSPIGCRHVAEVLAGEMSEPPIAHAERGAS